MADRSLSCQLDSVPTAFEAFEDIAAYVDGRVTRSEAITLGRDACAALEQDFRHRDLRAVRVWMRPVEGAEADEFFYGEFDSGWIEVNHRPLNAAQRANLTPFWKVEPR